MTKSHSSAATLTSLCPDISPTNSLFFEVLYVGKMKVSHRKVPETFIDDALVKIQLYEMEKTAKKQCAMTPVANNGKICDISLNGENVRDGVGGCGGGGGDGLKQTNGCHAERDAINKNYEENLKSETEIIQRANGLRSKESNCQNENNKNQYGGGGGGGDGGDHLLNGQRATALTEISV